MAKGNPLVMMAFGFVIIAGLAIAALPFVMADTDRGSEALVGNERSVGLGREVFAGSDIRIEYDISGGTADVVLDRHATPTGSAVEVIERQNDRGQGTITHHVTETGYYFITFSGRDIEIDYSYKISGGPLKGGDWIAIGLGAFLVLMGLWAVYNYTHMQNPKFMGKTLLYLSLLIILLGLLRLGLAASDGDGVDACFGLFWVVLGILYLSFNKTMGSTWNMRTHKDPDETREIVKRVLDNRMVPYTMEKFHRVGFLEYHSFFMLEGGMYIGLRHAQLVEWKSMVGVGPEKLDNQALVRGLADELARELECENYVPVE